MGKGKGGKALLLTWGLGAARLGESRPLGRSEKWTGRLGYALGEKEM